jgi:hypothetical protein
MENHEIEQYVIFPSETPLVQIETIHEQLLDLLTRNSVEPSIETLKTNQEPSEINMIQDITPLESSEIEVEIENGG